MTGCDHYVPDPKLCMMCICTIYIPVLWDSHYQIDHYPDTAQHRRSWRKKRSSFGQMKLLECFLKVKCKETYRAISREGMLKCLQIAYSPGLYWDWETLIQQFWFWPETNIIEISQQINYKLYLLCLRHTNILFFYWWTISKKRKPLMKGILDPVGTFQIVKQ